MDADDQAQPLLAAVVAADTYTRMYRMQTARSTGLRPYPFKSVEKLVEALRSGRRFCLVLWDATADELESACDSDIQALEDVVSTEMPWLLRVRADQAQAVAGLAALGAHCMVEEEADETVLRQFICTQLESRRLPQSAPGLGTPRAPATAREVLEDAAPRPDPVLRLAELLRSHGYRVQRAGAGAAPQGEEPAVQLPMLMLDGRDVLIFE